MARRIVRGIAAGALAAAAVAAPAYAALSTPETATPQAGCTAWLGSRIDGQCIAWSMSGNGGVGGGIPPVAIGAPGSGNPGLSTGPLLPGTSWNIPLN
jgi:hypothetical protein